MKYKAAFTLIEMLVVIAIISILISLGGSALHKSKQQARAVVCCNNQKQLLLAWTTYYKDHDGSLCKAWPAERADDLSTWVRSPWRTDGVDEQVPDTKKCSKEERIEGIKRGVLYCYLQTPKVYHCNNDNSTYKHYRSYSIPDCLNGYWTPHVLQEGWTIHTRFQTLKRPAERYVFVEENDGGGYNWGSWALKVDDQFWWDPIAVWHDRASNLAFADGHVSKRNWSHETAEHFSNYNNSSGTLWPQTEGGIADLKFMQQGWSQ